MENEMTEVAKMTPQDQAVETQNADPMVSMIERLATDPNADLEKLERMLAMKERMEDRAREDRSIEAQRVFFSQLAKAQSEIPVVLKNKNNEQTRSKYADLAAIEAQAMPVIRSHGFAVSAWPVSGAGDGMQRVRFRVSHELGHTDELEDDFPLDGSGLKGTQNKTPLHAKGSTVSYARRYFVAGYFNIATTDDDGNSGGGKASGPITEEQFAALRDLIEKAKADEDKLLRYFKIDHLGELPANRYGDADAMLRKKIKQKEPQQ